MKNLLLLSAAVLFSAATVMATDTDITPKAYDYNNATSFSYCPSVGMGANFNLNYSVPLFTALNGTEYWNDGLVAVSGGSFLSHIDALTAGTSIVDLGGTTGKVLCISGMNSTINDELKELYGVDMNIPSCTSSMAWFNINWFTDPNNTPKMDAGSSLFPSTTIRVRIHLNVYTNSIATNTAAINSAYCVDDQNNVKPSGSNTAEGVALNTDEFGKFWDDLPSEGLEEDDEGLPFWNPAQWMVYEYDTFCKTDEDGVTYGPLRIKMEMNATTLASSTIFIKKIEFIEKTENSDPIGLTRTKTYEYFTLAPSPAGVSSATVDNAPEYTINGQAVTFTEDAVVYSLSGSVVAEAEAGVAQTLNKGFYVAKVGDKGVKFVIR